MNTARKKIHITTLGCSKNIYDSELLMGQLIQSDAQLVSSSEEADIIIINTCGFIAQAKQESIDAILEAEQLKKSDPDKKVIVCGCLSQRYATELKKDIPTVDAYYGTEDFQNILQFLNLNGNTSPDYLYEQRYLSTPSHYAYLKISEGCNHKCSFCAIPLMRGKHRSKPMEHIIAEARQLADKGVKELIIISQDTTFYGLDLYNEQKIVDLLRELEKIEGVEWIRLHYLYPTTVQDQLISTMAQSVKIVPYLDMPIQHISDHMLKIMKRGGSSKRIRDIFNKARTMIPDVTLRSTLIVGHPGETESDFQLLKEFIQEIKFDRLGVFMYSHEENTSSYQMGDLSNSIKEKRFGEIMEIQQKISMEKNQAQIRKIKYVIIDEVNENESIAVGRTMGDSPDIDNGVMINGLYQDVKSGQFVNVRIMDAMEYDLFGKIEEI
jgi:ribosomal protein S12 methylthiotransferase